MWFVQPKQDYISQMPWKHTDESAVMNWQVRTRNYDTFSANILLAILSVVNLIGAYVVFVCIYICFLRTFFFLHFNRGGGCLLFLY